MANSSRSSVNPSGTVASKVVLMSPSGCCLQLSLSSSLRCGDGGKPRQPIRWGHACVHAGSRAERGRSRVLDDRAALVELSVGDCDTGNAARAKIRANRVCGLWCFAVQRAERNTEQEDRKLQIPGLPDTRRRMRVDILCVYPRAGKPTLAGCV